MVIARLVILILLFLFCVWNVATAEPSPPDLDPEEAAKSAIELHRIRRRFDVAMTQREIRHNAEVMRRRMAEELRDHDHRS